MKYIGKEYTMIVNYKVLLGALIVLVSLWGCSSSGSGGNSAAPDELQDEVFSSDLVGAALCINCHRDPGVFDDPEFGARSRDIVQKYLSGVHVIHSSHINAESGAFCLGCHDPNGDGPLLEPLINPADVPAEGLAAVTCEVCHGSGSNHWGIGPMPDGTPNYDVCGQCHNDTLPDSHLPFHPEGDNVLGRYLASRHFTAGVINDRICSRCHTDKGARIYRTVETRTGLMNEVEPVDSDEPVQCRTCHNAHGPDSLLREETMELGQVVGSAEYATCTNCHQGDNAAVQGPDEGLHTTLIFHEDRHARVITDSHYDDPATAGMIEGYVVDRLSDRACRDCHNPHDALDMTLPDTLTLNEQWAESGHAGTIRRIKREAAALYADMVPSMDNTVEQLQGMKEAAAASSWSIYDWDNTDGFGDCQRCHSATGLENFLNDPDGYALDGSENDFSHLTGWARDPAAGAVIPSGQNELLYCWGCHADGVGSLRNGGNSLLLYDRNNQHFATIPDIGKSTVCLACHGGRGNTETMINSPRSSLFQGHGPTRGALVFTAITHIGYEFAGLNYNYGGYFHDQIGLNNDTPESGKGPCVSCHMPEENHTFAAAEYDENGTFLAVVDPLFCRTCHVIEGLLPPLRLGQDEAVELLGAYVTNNIANYLNTDVAANFDSVPLDAYGAFQNLKYFQDGDPCGYVHNPVYSRRLIFDSIDWLDNGVLDGLISIPANYPNARLWLFADSNGNAARR